MVAKKSSQKGAKPAKKQAVKPVTKAAPKPAKKALAKPVPKAPGKHAQPAKAPAKVAKPAAKPAAKVPAKAPAKEVKQASTHGKPAAKAPAKPAVKTVTAAPAKPAAPVAPTAPVKAAVPAPSAKPAKVESVIEKPVKAVELTNGKMSAFVAKQKQRLLDLRDELVNSMYGVTRDTLRNAPEGSEASGSGMHQGDAGSDAYDRDFALSVLAKEQDALYEIEEALKRIDRGTYGVCEMSGRRIPQARLEAIPFARLTVECQAEWEKEHGNRRFRPSSEVGFGGGVYEEEEESESVSLDDEED